MNAADPLMLDAIERHLARDRANFRLALLLAFAFVALIVALQLIAAVAGDGPVELGVRPRTAIGLLGILFAPLLHADFAHVLSNAVPLGVIGTALLYLYPQSARTVLPAVYFGPGAAVWLVGRDSMHLGASGLVYGMFAYVLTAGLLRRDRRALAAALMVVLLYGTLVWGVLPIQPRMSWETHLAAAVIGVLLAFALQKRDVRRPESYDGEVDDRHEDDAARYDDWGWRAEPVEPAALVVMPDTAEPRGDARTTPPASPHDEPARSQDDEPARLVAEADVA